MHTPLLPSPPYFPLSLCQSFQLLFANPLLYLFFTDGALNKFTLIVPMILQLQIQRDNAKSALLLRMKH